MSITGLQINPFEDNYPFQSTFSLFWVFSNFILNKVSLHKQHLLSLTLCGRKIGVVRENASDFLQRYNFLLWQTIRNDN